MLKIQNLRKSYGKRTVLDNVNMNIPKGKVYALIGPNGAGKSTIMKILTGLINKTSGSITFEGRGHVEICRKLEVLLKNHHFTRI